MLPPPLTNAVIGVFTSLVLALGGWTWNVDRKVAALETQALAQQSALAAAVGGVRDDIHEIRQDIRAMRDGLDYNDTRARMNRRP